MKKLTFCLLFLIFITGSFIAEAQEFSVDSVILAQTGGQAGSGGTGGQAGSGGTGGQAGSGGTGGQAGAQCNPALQICNPLKGINNFPQLVDALINIVTQLGAIIAVLFIIWSGFLFIKAQGNPKELDKAKSTFYTTIIGIAILLGASVAAKIILTTLTSIIK